MLTDFQEEVKLVCKSLKSCRKTVQMKKKKTLLCKIALKSSKGESFSKMRKDLGVSWEFLVRCANQEEEDTGRKKRRDASCPH